MLLEINQIHFGNNLDLLKNLPDNSVSAVVTDPPAGISFMSKGWDSDKGGRDKWIAWLTEIFVEVKRVLKPGGHCLVWAIPRTSHWTAMALENAGLETRDCITHIFSTGFPKSQNISKSIDKQFGNIRKSESIPGGEWGAESEPPISDEAKKWDGWGSSLKPAAEFWWLVRKPISEKTVAANILKWGTGGINIDGSRISMSQEDRAAYEEKRKSFNFAGKVTKGWKNSSPLLSAELAIENSKLGRWPANLIFECICDEIFTTPETIKMPEIVAGGIWGNTTLKSTGKAAGPKYSGGSIVHTNPECPCYLLDEQSGVTKSGKVKENKEAYDGVSNTKFLRGVSNQNNQHGDSGGASRCFQTIKSETEQQCQICKNNVNGANSHSNQINPQVDSAPIVNVPIRFAYQAKASRREKEEGLELLESKQLGMSNGAQIHGEDYDKGQSIGLNRTVTVKNVHPTVKPIKLMEYLIKLVTPPGGLVLDIFAGSGSTCIAAQNLGFNFLGFELETEYVEIARTRLAHWKNKESEPVKEKHKKKDKSEIVENVDLFGEPLV